MEEIEESMEVWEDEERESKDKIDEKRREQGKM